MSVLSLSENLLIPTFTIIQQVCIWIVPVLLAITLHEAAHAFAAYRCGDTTAKSLGRMSLNPIRHIDPVGTIIIPLLIGILTQFSFIIGYAKPVPVNWSRLKNPKRDMVLVAFAGPFANFLMAFLWACGFKLALLLHPQTSNAALFLMLTSRAGIMINLVLGFLNLLPFPPLDGSRIVSAFLKPKQALAYSKIEPYGFFILIFLVLTGILGKILVPLINAGYSVLGFVLQL